MVVSGVTLPPTQQVIAYNSIGDAIAEIPYQQRRIGDIVAIRVAPDVAIDYQTDQYLFYYWAAGLTNAGTLEWKLRRVSSGTDYKTVRVVLADGIQYPLPPGHTLHRVAFTCVHAQTVTINNGIDPIIVEDIAPNTVQWVTIDYTNNTNATQIMDITRTGSPFVNSYVAMYLYNFPFDWADF